MNNTTEVNPTRAPELLKQNQELKEAFSVENRLHTKAVEGWEKKDLECRNLKALNAELLEALKDSREWFWLNAKDKKIPLDGTTGTPKCWESINRAIAKAEGK